jgi:NAD-dependent SIR2 family protein deacetylase
MSSRSIAAAQSQDVRQTEIERKGMNVERTALIAGAGLSAVAGIPTTRELPGQFLGLPSTDATPAPLQDVISEHLRQYWERVFGYEAGGAPPSFEDHFTVLDLAANTGHQLGSKYSPKQLRAIRRLSIHRVFDVLNTKFRHSEELSEFLSALANGVGNGILTTNWDIAIERHLSPDSFHYSVAIERPRGGLYDRRGVPLLKLHGSANWAYCDCCSRLYAFEPTQGKGALYKHVFIDKEDLRMLAAGDKVARLSVHGSKAKCYVCQIALSSRVATFSYAKVLNFVHFLSIWDDAFTVLRNARHWVFVGYSLPEADFQLRHLLKAAQLGRAEPSEVKVTVVTNQDPSTIERFQRFFGASVEAVENAGFQSWWRGRKVAAQSPLVADGGRCGS